MYKITVEEIKEVTTSKQGNYCILETRAITSAEREEMCQRVNNSNDSYDRQEGRDEIEKYKLDKDSGMYVKNIYGNPPPVSIVVEKETKIFEQVVETLNIADMIVAINGLSSQ